MVYKNLETGQTGTLKQLLPKSSAPQNLSEEELQNLGIEKIVEIPRELTLEEVKKAKINEINSNYDYWRNEPFIYNGNKVHFDEKSLQTYANIVISFIVKEEKTNQIIRLVDNSFLTLTEIEFKDLVGQMEDKVQELEFTRFALKDYINSLEKIEDVQNVWWLNFIEDEDTQEITEVIENTQLISQLISQNIGGN
jgi:hypothetical protein